MREWTELGIQTQEACEELRLLNEEICKLEHILDAHKTLSGGEGGGGLTLHWLGKSFVRLRPGKWAQFAPMRVSLSTES